ncbi:hypothetical protein Y032_0029g1892 [Ancylostoma ceylanicum]|nr:hypothetical protein Y032_0029g1892 [Ancylostoma ceylanicum]
MFCQRTLFLLQTTLTVDGIKQATSNEICVVLSQPLPAKSVQYCILYMIRLPIHVSPLLKKSASAAGDSSRGMVGCFGTTFVPHLDNGSNQTGVILVDIVYLFKGLLGSNNSNHFLVYDSWSRAPRAYSEPADLSSVEMQPSSQ